MVLELQSHFETVWENGIEKYDNYPLMGTPYLTMVYSGTICLIAPIIIPQLFNFFRLKYLSLKLIRAILYFIIVLLCIYLCVNYFQSNTHNTKFWCTINPSFFTNGQEDLYLTGAYLYFITHLMNCFDIILLLLEGLPVSKIPI
jgi:uncharacterized protein YacL